MHKVRKYIEDKSLTVKLSVAIPTILFIIGTVWGLAHWVNEIQNRITDLEKAQVWMTNALHNLHQNAPK